MTGRTFLRVPLYSSFAGCIGIFYTGFVDIVDDSIYGLTGDYDLRVIGRLNQLAVEEDSYFKIHGLNHPFL